MTENTLANYFKPVLYKFHDREAIVYKTGYRSIRCSYLDLYDHAYRMANWFQYNGLGKGLLACAITGVIATPLDLRVQPDFVRHIAEETGAKAGIKSRYQNSPMEFRWWNVEELPLHIKNAPPIFREPEISEDDILEIVYTSGTTGEPKGVILTNRNIVSNIRSVGKILSFNKDWRFLSILPMSHMFEQTVGLFIPLFFGCSITYLKSRKSSVIMKAMQEERITSIITVPLMLQTLRDRIFREVKSQNREALFNMMLGIARRLPRRGRRVPFRTLHNKFGGDLEFFCVGGAPLDPETERFWNTVGIKVVQGYGLTETSPIITCNTITEPRAGTVGRVLPDQHLKLSENGEILVKGDNVTSGYYKRPDLHDQYFEDGWYCTGDVGELDQEGYLRIKGRTKNMILTASGMNVYPEDIEEALNRNSVVKDSCVLGLDREGKIVIHAVLLLADSAADGKSIIGEANACLADHQKIQAFSVWEKGDFPRTPTLKIQRRFVLEELAGESTLDDKGGALPESHLYTIIRSVADVKESDLVPEATLGLDPQIDSLLRVELQESLRRKGA
jgi:long-chain acyl-CoA synthetase